MRRYGDLQSLENENYLLYLSATGELALLLVVYMPKQFKTFTVRVDDKIFNEVKTPGFNFASLEYIDISKEVRDSKTPAALTYIFEDPTTIPDEILRIARISQITKPKVEEFLQ